MNAITKYEAGVPALSMDESDLLAVLQSSLYPGADLASIKLVIGYCRAAGLDPMQKPVHIVPMYDKATGRLRDVIMPGIGLYRTQAARSNAYAGIGEPEFGPEVTQKIGGVEVTYPQWCRVTVRRALPSGHVAEFTAVERWLENYAVKGGKERSIAPNAMWMRRPYGQIGKCAQAQALRIAFPEIGAQPTADEMEGGSLDPDAWVEAAPVETIAMPRAKAATKDADVADVEPKVPSSAEPQAQQPDPQATAPAANDALTTAGERAYITKRAGDGLGQLLQSVGAESLDVLTKSQFAAAKAQLMRAA